MLPPRSSLWETAGYALPKAWRTCRRHVVAMACSAVISAITAPVMVVILGVLVSNIENLGTAAADQLPRLLPWILLAGGASLVTALCRNVQQYCKLRLGDQLRLKVQNDLLTHAGHLDLETIEDAQTQDILERAKQDGGTNFVRFSDSLLKVVASCLQVAGLSVILFWIAPFWSSVLLALVVPFVLLGRWVSRVRYQRQRNMTRARRWTRYYSRKLTERDSVPSSKVLGLGPLLLDRYRQFMEEIVAQNKRTYRLEAAVRLGLAVASISVLLFAVSVVGYQAANRTIGVGQFVAFWLAVWKFRGALTTLVASFSNLQNTQLSILNTREFFNIPRGVRRQGTWKPGGVDGTLQLNDVSFTYPRCKRPVIQNLSLSIRPGETVAIVGANGAGKTTLAKLLAGLYRPSEGQVTLDGTPLGDYAPTFLQEQLAFVFQQPQKYEATVHDNIVFGDWPRLLARPQEVPEIAGRTGVAQMINALPQGYETLLGKRFGNYDLSGGQWQKLAICRAMACDPSIVILDEPASNLDIDSEHALYREIQQLTCHRTTVLISHRFSTVGMADRIFVLDEGRLVEEGTRDQLLALDGRFAAMWRVHEANWPSPVTRLRSKSA